MARLVELTGSYTQASHEEQDDTEDGEDAGGSHRTCINQRRMVK